MSINNFHNFQYSNLEKKIIFYFVRNQTQKKKKDKKNIYTILNFSVYRQTNKNYIDSYA